MGADIHVEGRVAVVYGVPALHGAQVQATDLRGGAALVVAALGAERIWGRTHRTHPPQRRTAQINPVRAALHHAPRLTQHRGHGGQVPGEGESRITGLHHIDRGYQDLVGDLTLLGADIRRE